MNSYELVRPDGTGTGVWACGACNKVHLVAQRANVPVSDLNREFAEKCCVPRNCRYCGEQTDRDLFGEYGWAHETCIPKYEVAPPHPSMANPFARLLYQKMSAISQDCWAAGWMMGNEYALWDALHGASHRYGWSHISYEELEELRVLSELAGGWIWTGPPRTYTPQFVSFEIWKSIVESVDESLADEIGLDV